VLLADDLPECVAALEQILEGECEIVGSACNGEDAVALSERLRPDVLILDIDMPGMDGLEAARRLRLGGHPPRIVFQTGHSDPDYLEAAQRAGCIGYVLKPRAGRDLATAVMLAMEGREFVSPGMAVKS
jgi:DNA-binding NarL/FixJ family response regulator